MRVLAPQDQDQAVLPTGSDGPLAKPTVYVTLKIVTFQAAFLPGVVQIFLVDLLWVKCNATLSFGTRTDIF